ncbi:site-specific integrase [Candidatus Nomurabacteria bacterium]|nr:site-specific integrase [Candidatus Nomurabacteria bacterium]
MPEIHFYPSHYKRAKSSINIVFHIEKQQYKIPSGESCLVKYWIPKKQRVKECSEYSDSYTLNRRLNFIQDTCAEVVRDFSLKMTIPTLREISLIIEAKIKPNAKTTALTFSEFIKDHIKKVNVSPNTMKRYVTTLAKLEAYQAELNLKVNFSDVDMIFYNSFLRWMNSKKYSLNYTGDSIKNLKAFFKAANDEGLHNLTLPDKFKVISEDSDSIYLNKDELQRLYDLEINEDLLLDNVPLKILNVKGNMERMLKSLRDCRDRFLIGSYTAMRFSDYAFLSGVKSTDRMISRTSQKTGVRTVIPMHPTIKEILKARENKLPPPVSNQKMNDQLKLLCKLAKINEVVEITITKGGKKERSIKKKWELVTTHTARRSGATNMYLSGIDSISIMAFTGHKTVKNFMKYIRVSQQENADRLQEHPYFKNERTVNNGSS